MKPHCFDDSAPGKNARREHLTAEPQKRMGILGVNSNVDWLVGQTWYPIL